MKPFWERTIKYLIPILCVLFVFLVLWANRLITIPWRTGTLESFYDIKIDAINAAFLLSYPDGTYLVKRDAEKLDNYLYSLRLRPKFWQSGVRLSDVKAQIFLHNSTDIRLELCIVDENTIEVNSHVYKVMDGVDFYYILSCFDGAEDLSYLYNGTAIEE